METKKKILSYIVLSASLLLMGCVTDNGNTNVDTKENIDEHWFQLETNRKAGEDLFYKDEICGFEVKIPRKDIDQNNIREEAKTYKQQIADRYLIEFVFPSPNTEYVDNYLPKSLHWYVSILRLSCIPKNDVNHIESELGAREKSEWARYKGHDPLHGEWFGRQFLWWNNWYFLVLSLGDTSQEQRSITTEGIDRENIYNSFMKGFTIIGSKSKIKAPTQPWKENLFVGKGTQLSRRIKELTSTSTEDIIYKNEEIWFQILLPKEFSWGEVSEYYRLYEGSNRIIFTLPKKKNFSQYFKDSIEGSYQRGISPWYQEFVSIFYFSPNEYEAFKNNGWWGYWGEEDLINKTLWKNDQYYFIIETNGITDTQWSENLPEMTRGDLVKYIKDSFVTPSDTF